MTIWVDADACPNVIKEVLYRAADRTQIELVLVANQYLRVPPSRFIRAMVVPKGFDVADNEIVRLCQPGDLVITADIPLAVSSILHSKTFDNGMICASEQSVIVAKEIYAKFKKEMQLRGAYFLSSVEAQKVRKTIR